MTVAVFGGSFSPVHEGHLAVAEGVIKQKMADMVWMLPCRRNPLKDAAPAYSDDQRVELLREAIQEEERQGRIAPGTIKVDDIEYSMPEPSYTCDTLRELQKRYPEIEFRLVVGGDTYKEFHRWKNREWIEKNFSPIVYPRPGYELTEVAPDWTLLTGVRTVDISSTQIRNQKIKP